LTEDPDQGSQSKLCCDPACDPAALPQNGIDFMRVLVCCAGFAFRVTHSNISQILEIIGVVVLTYSHRKGPGKGFRAPASVDQFSRLI
jgi:hypothetical protein